MAKIQNSTFTDRSSLQMIQKMLIPVVCSQYMHLDKTSSLYQRAGKDRNWDGEKEDVFLWAYWVLGPGESFWSGSTEGISSINTQLDYMINV